MNFLNKMNSGDLVALLAISGALLAVLLAIICGFLYSYAKIRHEASLRRDMMDRGMTAEEIEIATANFGRVAFMRTTANAGTGLDCDVALATALAKPREADNGSFSPETIETVLDLFRQISQQNKPAILKAIQEMIEAEVKEPQMVAAVSVLCKSDTKTAPTIERESDQRRNTSETAAYAPSH